MKKVFAILLVLALVVGFVFAGNNDALKLKSTVGEVLPVYEIHSVDKSNVDKTGATTAVEVDTGLDISVQDIEWNFYIKQVGEKDSKGTSVEFAKTKKTATLTVTLGHFTGSDTGKVATDKPVFKAMAAVDPDGDNANVASASKTVVTVPSGDALKSSTAEITLAYKGVNWADQNVVTFTGTWTKDATLPMDDYYANVTLTYTTSN